MATTKNDKANAIKAAEELGHSMTQFPTGAVGINTASCKNCSAKVSVDQDHNTPDREPWGSALEEQCPETGA
jgi:hypothetical protein